MLTEAAIFLLDTVVTAFLGVLLLRFYLQLLRVPYSNPLSQFVIALTNFVVLPVRRAVPGVWGMDMATLLLAWALQVFLLMAIDGLVGVPLLRGGLLTYLGYAGLALVELLRMSLYLLMLVQLLLFVVSLVNPFSPFMGVLASLSRPFTQLVRRFVPPIGTVDLSPMVIVIACQLMLMLPVRWLELVTRTMINSGMLG
jgi:YggT family protein